MKKQTLIYLDIKKPQSRARSPYETVMSEIEQSISIRTDSVTIHSTVYLKNIHVDKDTTINSLQKYTALLALKEVSKAINITIKEIESNGS